MLVIALLVVVLAPARTEIPRKIADIIRAEAGRGGLDPVLLPRLSRSSRGLQTGARGWSGITPNTTSAGRSWTVARSSGSIKKGPGAP